MGNQNASPGKSHPRIAKDVPLPQIRPYIPGQIVDAEPEGQSPSKTNATNNEDGGGRRSSSTFDDHSYLHTIITQPAAVAEGRFSAEELARIKKEFEKLSKDGVIGKRKLLEYFRIMELNESYLTNELFFLVKNCSQLNSPVDYPKFINFVSVLAMGTKAEKLQLFFLLFKKDSELKVSKEDVKAHISGTILSLSTIQFDDQAVEMLKFSVSRAPEAQLEAALDLLVEDIFQKYSSNREELTFDEWCAWFAGLEGMAEVLEIKKERKKVELPPQKQNKGYLDKTSSLNSSIQNRP